MSNRRKIRRHDRRQRDEIALEYNPGRLSWGVGSGTIREQTGEEGERVAAAILLQRFLNGPLGELEPDMNVDRLIEALRSLVAAGLLTEDGPNPAWMN